MVLDFLTTAISSHILSTPPITFEPPFNNPVTSLEILQAFTHYLLLFRLQQVATPSHATIAPTINGIDCPGAAKLVIGSNALY
jgi:hypothetical protein